MATAACKTRKLHTGRTAGRMQNHSLQVGSCTVTHSVEQAQPGLGPQQNVINLAAVCHFPSHSDKLVATGQYAISSLTLPWTH